MGFVPRALTASRDGGGVDRRGAERVRRALPRPGPGAGHGPALPHLPHPRAPPAARRRRTPGAGSSSVPTRLDRGRARTTLLRGQPDRRLREAADDMAVERLPGLGPLDARRGSEGSCSERAAPFLAIASAPGAALRSARMTDLTPDFFTKPVADVDPEIAEVLVNEAARQESTLEMIASENFVPQADPRLPGLGAHQQVRGGLSRAVATTAAASSWTSPRHLAIERAKKLFGAEHVNVQPHAGRAGQRRRLPRAARARGPHPRHEARPRRPPDPRDEDQLLRPPLRRRGLRRARGGLAHRHGRAGPARRGRAAEADPRRVVGLPAPARLRALPRDRRLGGRVPRGGHGPLRRARGRRGAPEPGAVRRRGQHHGAQDAGRRPRRDDPLPRGVRQEDRLGHVPGPAGRAADACDRRQGRGHEDRRHRAVPRASAPHPRGRGGRGRGDAVRRGERAHRRHRRAPGARRPARVRARRPAGRGPPRRRRASP